MMKKGFFYLIMSFYALMSYCYAQNIFHGEVKYIGNRKKSVYFKSGAFIKKGQASLSKLQSIRHFYSPKNGYERIVLDIKGHEVPNIYSYIEANKIYIDLLNTTINENIRSTGKSQFVNNLLFYPLDDDMLSLEIDLNRAVEAEIFFLENPSRLVLDIKK